MSDFHDRLALARHADGPARAPGKPAEAVSGPSTRSGGPTLKSLPTGLAEAPRLVPVRTVPRALLDELVARLVASGAVEMPEASPHG